MAQICEQKALAQLPLVNQEMLSLKAKSDQPREVWLDIDDSVITVFGKQEGANVGYNPRYHGRSSYKVKVAFISGTCELVHAGLYSGTVASNGQFIDFLEETLEILAAQNIIVKGIRMDKGFEKDKKDARVTRLKLTDQIYEFSQLTQSKATIFTQALFKGIEKDDMSKARAVLQKILFNLTEMDQPERDE